jgi:anti-sigma factor RsiW
MNDLNPTPCSMWEVKLAALHPDDLSPLEQKALKAHLASCPACEAVLADYYRLRNLMRNAFIPACPPGIWKNFLPGASKQSVMHILSHEESQEKKR